MRRRHQTPLQRIAPWRMPRTRHQRRGSGSGNGSRRKSLMQMARDPKSGRRAARASPKQQQQQTQVHRMWQSHSTSFADCYSLLSAGFLLSGARGTSRDFVHRAESPQMLCSCRQQKGQQTAGGAEGHLLKGRHQVSYMSLLTHSMSLALLTRSRAQFFCLHGAQPKVHSVAWMQGVAECVQAER